MSAAAMPRAQRKKNREPVSVDMSYPSRTSTTSCDICFRMVSTRKLKRHQRSRMCSDVVRALMVRGIDPRSPEPYTDGLLEGKSETRGEVVFRAALSLCRAAERWQKQHVDDNRGKWREIQAICKRNLARKKKKVTFAEEEKDVEPIEPAVIVDEEEFDAIEHVRAPLLVPAPPRRVKKHTSPNAVKDQEADDDEDQEADDDEGPELGPLDPM